MYLFTTPPLDRGVDFFWGGSHIVVKNCRFAECGVESEMSSEQSLWPCGLRGKKQCLDVRVLIDTSQRTARYVKVRAHRPQPSYLFGSSMFRGADIYTSYHEYSQPTIRARFDERPFSLFVLVYSSPPPAPVSCAPANDGRTTVRIAHTASTPLKEAFYWVPRNMYSGGTRAYTRANTRYPIKTKTTRFIAPGVPYSICRTFFGKPSKPFSPMSVSILMSSCISGRLALFQTAALAFLIDK